MWGGWLLFETIKNHLKRTIKGTNPHYLATNQHCNCEKMKRFGQKY